MQSETDRIFCHFGPFLSFYHHTHPLPSHPMLNDPENQNFEKKKTEKNAWRYYPFIHTCVP